MEEKASREVINYEYKIISTSKFIPEPIDEFWEIYKVIPSYLDNGSQNFIVVFRQPYPTKETE